MDIKVTANGPGANGIDWDIDGKKPHESKIDFDKGSGPHKIKFRLDDRTSRDLRFDAANPIWDHKSEAECPPAGSNSDQIEIIDCTDTQLTVVNKNSGEACTLHYQLNFRDGVGSAEPVDPIFKNGGGGST
jgi:hypothetical protein